MKTGITVRVKNQKSKHYNLKGIAINSGPQFTTVKLFDTNEVVTFPNEALEQTTHVSRPNIESEALKSIGEKLQELKAKIASEKERHSKYNTDAAIQGRATCELIEGWVKDLFQIETK
jgi:hypothetical protein